MQLRLSNAQTKFLTATTRAKLFIGGIGSGKSRILCYNAIIECLKGRKTAIISFSYRNLKDVISKTLIECLVEKGYIENKDFSFNKSDMDFIIGNNAILLRSADQPDKLRGLNLHSFFLDECRSLNQETLDIMLGRIRLSSDAFWGGCSTTRGKDYIYNLIVKEGLESVFKTGFAANEKLTVVLQSTFKSPFLPKEYKEDLKKQYSTQFAMQELYGQIVDFSNGLINVDWFKYDDTRQPVNGVRFWDLAVSTKTSADYSVGCLLSKRDKYTINNIVRVKMEYPDLRKLIIQTALNDGNNIVLGLEQAGQQLAIINDISRAPELQGFVIKTVIPTKDLITRSLPWISQLELGNVILNRGHWNKDLLDECGTFSVENLGKYKDDQISAICGAYELINKRTSVQFISMNQL